jgi:N-acyl-D-amino-acid deacylase
MAGDILVFDEKRVGDRATFDNPHQYAEGFSYVIVNGKVVVDDGKHTRIMAGRGVFGPGRP